MVQKQVCPEDEGNLKACLLGVALERSKRHPLPTHVCNSRVSASRKSRTEHKEEAWQATVGGKAAAALLGTRGGRRLLDEEVTHLHPPPHPTGAVRRGN